jgi:predicted transcriptional regulator of viral defense system
MLNPTQVRARPLSKAEAHLVSQLEFESELIIDIDAIQRLTGLDRNSARILATRLVKKGWLARVRRGVYQFVPAQMGGYERQDWFMVLQAVRAPYYLSFLTAAYHYGLTPQRPTLAQIATPRRIRALYATPEHGIEQIVVSEGRLFGMREETRDRLTITIATPEKAVIDCLDAVNRCGGILEVARIVHRAARRLDVATLVGYAIRVGTKTLSQRLGYLLELAGVDPEDTDLRRLKESLGRRRAYLASVSLYGRKGSFVPRWGLIDNVGQDRLLSEAEF